ncbi:YhgE/Pip domain-containing protein [Paenibacillus profundus]|uniref:YhgE/Pip domain-containing protein n=1 Tax=Paenibacillus profundus TaxID=1173085 RepID=A0ABS8YS43_9BACL|nr:YhgE/Pip domain-containing protein [Paenibacillus profundus]MCE5172449.1 YhgE/Pip domain-containing protein [Paenibacillus profundus]
MKHIFSIYATDLKNITRNWAAFIIIVGLIGLPSLYAWFNILASWDPYGNTKGIAIAVANNDKGTTILDKPINIGKEIVASLKENTQIGWTFVDEKKALTGVKRGTYYASIIVPDSFSARIGTVLSDEPVKAEIVYYVNEKINAISPKITSKGASSIIEQVSSNFVKTANRTIFQIFNEIGVELKNELPTIEKVKSLVFKLEKGFPEFVRIANTALADVSKANEIVQEAQKNLPLVAQIAAEGEQFSQRIGELLKYSQEGIEAISPFIKQDLASVQQTSLAMEQLTAIVQDVNAKPSVVLNALDQASRRLDTALKIVNGTIEWLGRLNQLTPGNIFGSEIGKLQRIADKFGQQLSTISEMKTAVNAGRTISGELADRLNRLARDTAAIAGDLLGRYDGEIKPKILQGVNKARSTVANTQTLLHDALKRIPDVKNILNDAAKALTFGNQEIIALKRDLPVAQSKIKHIADKIRALEAQGDINEIIDLLRNNFEKESEFFAQPVVLKENKLYPIPNYGSAMSPFFTTLSLWVGALLLVSLLTVEVHREPEEMNSIQANTNPDPENGFHSRKEKFASPMKDHHVYFGRYLTFVTIALLQSLLVTTGDIYVLGAYVLNKLWFVTFGLILSAVFMLIVYTLVSVFGNVGKALSIVLLVLQLAGSGGTFPIQVTPPFFQAIHPYLPFTYGISMMREAVGGISWDVIQRDLLMMCIYVGLTLVIGLALKTPINRSSAKFVKKAKESKLIH